MYAYSLYKARKVPVKSPVCMICVERTRGKTQRVSFGYGVSVWLCATHSSVEFLTQRGGRDLVVTLTGIWRAAGALTTARHKAMDAHLAGQRTRPARARPGSYAWPAIRARAEGRFAQGEAAAGVWRRVTTLRFVNAEPPSRRTVQRWHAERRWVRPPPA